MDWIRENKFLAGLFGVLLVGAAFLGFLLYSAKARHAEVHDQYTQQASELRRLQTLPLYPDESNLKKLQEQKKQLEESAVKLQAQLNTMEYPVQPMTPEQFQDKLRASVSAAVEKSKKSGTKLLGDQKFYLGFDTYQATRPRSEAAPLLGRQLQAIETVVNLVLDARADAITALARTPLPEEGTGAAASPAPTPRGGAAAGKQTAAPLVSKNAFDIGITIERDQYRRLLNAIASSKNQFYILRTLLVANRSPKGPPRVEPGTETAVTPQPEAAATPPPEGEAATEEPLPSPAPGGTSPGGGSLKFLVGTEKLDAVLRIDIVDFAAPPTAAESPAPKAKAQLR